MGFSLRVYAQLLADIIASERRIMGVAAALRARDGQGNAGAVLIRHDVDRLPFRAVQMARLEQGCGVSTTYYFRCDRHGRFPEAAVATIVGLGHEAGYHYETLSAHGGDIRAAVDAFETNLRRLRDIAPVQSVAQHGAPLSPHDNQRLMEFVDLSANGLVGDAVTGIEALSPIYVTDTGGRWNAASKVNLRDRVGQADRVVDPGDRPAFADFLRSSDRLLYINAHPERWPRSPLGQAQASMTDGGVNMIKRLLALRRSSAAAVE